MGDGHEMVQRIVGIVRIGRRQVRERPQRLVLAAPTLASRAALKGAFGDADLVGDLGCGRAAQKGLAGLVPDGLVWVGVGFDGGLGVCVFHTARLRRPG